MDFLTITFYVTLALIALAFSVRVIIESWKFVYAVAPYIVLLAISMGMYLYAGAFNEETEVKDANHIEAVEDQSGRSEHRTERVDDQVLPSHASRSKSF